MSTAFKVHLDGDAENTALATSNSASDELLGDFYGTYPWPWQPTTFTYVDDSRLEAAMLNRISATGNTAGYQTIPPFGWPAAAPTRRSTPL